MFMRIIINQHKHHLFGNKYMWMQQCYWQDKNAVGENALYLRTLKTSKCAYTAFLLGGAAMQSCGHCACVRVGSFPLCACIHGLHDKINTHPVRCALMSLPTWNRTDCNNWTSLSRPKCQTNKFNIDLVNSEFWFLLYFPKWKRNIIIWYFQVGNTSIPLPRKSLRHTKNCWLQSWTLYKSVQLTVAEFL